MKLLRLYPHNITQGAVGWSGEPLTAYSLGLVLRNGRGGGKPVSFLTGDGGSPYWNILSYREISAYTNLICWGKDEAKLFLQEFSA